MEDYLMIGTVLKPQGIRGECKIKSYAAQVDRFSEWDTLFLKQEKAFLPFSFKLSHIRDGFVFGTLGECRSADDAERFRGCDLYIARSQALEPKGNAVLIADLISCEAVDETGTVVGTLTDVLQYGSVDTWVFRTPSGTLMVPALSAVFPEVSPQDKRISVCREKLEEVAVRNE